MGVEGSRMWGLSPVSSGMPTLLPHCQACDGIRVSVCTQPQDCWVTSFLSFGRAKVTFAVTSPKGPFILKN